MSRVRFPPAAPFFNDLSSLPGCGFCHFCSHPVRVGRDGPHRLAHGVVQGAGHVGRARQGAVHQHRVAVDVPGRGHRRRQRAVARPAGDADRQQVGADRGRAGLIRRRGQHLVGQAVAVLQRLAGRGLDRTPHRRGLDLGGRGAGAAPGDYPRSVVELAATPASGQKLVCLEV